VGPLSKLETRLIGVPRPGDTVAGNYIIEEQLGVGGMGAVMRARRLSDDMPVALKVMLAAEAQHSDSTKRFFREARAAGSIDSPHVTKLLDLGRLDDGMPFMVLELLEGRALDKIILEDAPLPIAKAVDFILHSCEGVAEAHARGIVHRDLKPSNLFCVQGAPPLIKVLDFGISKAMLRLDPGHDHQSLTETNATLGSPQYMSPEQLRNSKDVDARTDIWALGLILHKLITGLPAFEAKTVGEHFAMIYVEPPTPLRARRPDAPEGLEQAILMCLKRNLDERFQDVGQLSTAIAEYGPAGSEQRAARVVAILTRAGASSLSNPRMAALRDAPTVRVEPAPTSIPEPTTSQWSSSTHSAPPPSHRAPTARLVPLTALPLMVAVVAVWGLSRNDTLERVSAGMASHTRTAAMQAMLMLRRPPPVDTAAPATPAAASPAAPPAAAPDAAGGKLHDRRTTPRRDPPNKTHIKPKGPMEDTL